MVQLKCQNKKCNYQWEYKGKSPFYATCPVCYFKVNIEKSIILDDEVKNGDKNKNE